MLGIPLTIEKVEGLLTVLEFLGVLLDSILMEAPLHLLCAMVLLYTL